jgi:hypothetical protein
MPKYTKIDVSEQELEDLIRQHAGDIEDGLKFIDHQRRTDSGRLDVLLRDSGGALVVAELKVVEDDGMLMQAIDYYDYVSRNVEAFSRLYKEHSVDPKQELRLILVAPSFSLTLIGRCKWIDIPISLMTYTCLQFEGSKDVIPIFNEQSIPSAPEIIEGYTIEDHLGYIVDGGVRSAAEALLEEIRNWSPGKISLDPLKYAVSMKIKGKVFAYFHPRRKHYLLSTYNNDNAWTDYSIHDENDLGDAKGLMKAAMEARDK